MSAADLIAANLAALPHPDGGTRQLAGYNVTLLPDALREQIDSSARDIGAAIVYLLEQNGYEIRPPGSAASAADSSAEQPTVAHVHCVLCDTKMLSLNISHPEHVVADGRRLIGAMSGLSQECPHASV